MFIKMTGLYGMQDRDDPAWYRKIGTGCFDFVWDKEYASDMTEAECDEVLVHGEWYKKQYNASEITKEE